MIQWPRFCLSGHRRDFLLPDRSKYVNMEKRFLRSYMDLLVQTSHRLGALATGGMVALLLPQNIHSDSYRRVLTTVTRLERHSAHSPQIYVWFYVVLIIFLNCESKQWLIWEEMTIDKSSFWSFLWLMSQMFTALKYYISNKVKSFAMVTLMLI